MTNEEIHNIYLHISGKADGIAEATGSADFPVMFARAILEFNRLQRPWVGLTDDEAKRLWSENTGNQDPIGEDLEIIRNVEAYLKEKNL
jgi:hypothetical protein